MKKLLAGMFSLFIVAQAFAGMDTYGGFTLLQVSAPNTYRATTTNTAVDVHGFEGVVAIIVNVVSNSAGGDTPSLICDIQGSTTGTNAWSTLSSAAVSDSATIILTNIASGYGTNVATYTNTYYTPGTSFAGNAVYTNTASGIKEYGYVAAALPGWIRCVYTVGGTATVYSASVNLRGKRGYPYP